MNKRVVEIKKFLLDKGLRQTELADTLGMKTGTICNLIHGRSKSKRFNKYLVDLGYKKELLEDKAA